MAAGVPARLTPAQGREFAFTVGGAFLALAAFTWWRDTQYAWRVFAGLSGMLLVAGAVIPGKLGPVYRAWMGLAHLISKVTTPIVMGVVYFAVLTPIAVGMRLIGHRPMRHAEHDGGFWRAAPSGGRADLERQF